MICALLLLGVSPAEAFPSGAALDMLAAFILSELAE